MNMEYKMDERAEKHQMGGLLTLKKMRGERMCQFWAMLGL
jgi:hypothetical protein